MSRECLGANEQCTYSSAHRTSPSCALHCEAVLIALGVKGWVLIALPAGDLAGERAAHGGPGGLTRFRVVEVASYSPNVDC